MNVIAFDFYDKERQAPIQMKLNKKYVKKGEVFKKDNVSYQVIKVFKKKNVGMKCVEIKMVAYKIKNTVTKFAHICPAKKGAMDEMQDETKKILEKKYGKKTVDAWKKGKVNMKFGHLSSICPECKCVFWKEKDEKPEPFNIVNLKGKKKLVKRN